MSESCIFCKIVTGDVPCTKVYEDAESMAIMDIGPIIKGHTLVIPKAHYDPITRTPDAILQHLITIVRKIAAAQTEGLGASGVNITQANGASAGQVVPHIHFHVIPRFDDDGHSWNWNAREYDSPEEMEQVAGRIRQSLPEAS
jgi:histidine triad (HIT) family protein